MTHTPCFRCSSPVSLELVDASTLALLTAASPAHLCLACAALESSGSTFDPVESAASGAALEVTARSMNGLCAARDGASRLQEVAAQWANATPEQLAGRLAEELHASTFNIDAATKGLNTLHATTGAARGAGTAAADVEVFRAGQSLANAQVKFHGSAPSTTLSVARVKYDGMQRVVPSDQLSSVKELAARRGVDALGKRNYPDVASHASDRIQAGGAHSQPLSRPQALEMARRPSQAADRLVRGQAIAAIQRGAVAGAAVGGGVSAVCNLVAYGNGDKSGEEAFLDTAVDTAASGLSGAAVVGGTMVAEAALLRAGAGALARGSAPVALGLTALDMVKDVGRCMAGDIDGGELVGRAGANVVKGGITWGGMEGGAALGTAICPGVGTVVGGLIGGIAAGLFGGWLMD